MNNIWTGLPCKFLHHFTYMSFSLTRLISIVGKNIYSHSAPIIAFFEVNFFTPGENWGPSFPSSTCPLPGRGDLPGLMLDPSRKPKMCGTVRLPSD